MNKKISFIFMVALISPIVIHFKHNFVPESWVLEFSLYASLVLTVIFIVIFSCLYIKKSWKPAPAWYNYSKLKRVLLVPFVPFFIFGILWINLAISIPQLFTLVFGVDAVKIDVVLKDRHHSRRSCDYRLEPRSINTTFFHYCISERLYNQLPDKEMDSELLVKQSSLGFIVEHIRLPNQNR